MRLRFSLLAALALVAAPAYAQGMDHGDGEHADETHMMTPPMRGNDGPRASPNAGVMATIGTTAVHLHYGRPSVKGRTIFASTEGALVPYGQVWRTGANEATTVAFSGDVMIDGSTLPAGVYSLFTIPGEAEWTVIFNRVAQQWGSGRYDAEQDALRAMATPVTAATPAEQFEITFESITDDSAVMVLAWDDVRVPVTIRAAG